MNGNLKSVDNSKDTQGRHKDFIAVQRKVSLYLLTTTAKTRQAFSVWRSYAYKLMVNTM